MNRRTNWFWFLAFVLLSALAAITPPIQSPDENGHLARAYLLGHGQFLLHTLPQDQVDANASMAGKDQPHACCRQGGMLDRSLVQFMDAHLDLARYPARRLTPQEHDALAGLHWTGQTVAYSLPGAGYYFPAVYAPQALGLATGEVLGLGVWDSYTLARALTLAICLLLLAHAFAVWCPSPLTSALLLLPMTLFQFTAPTIDGVTTALTVWVLCQALAQWSRPTLPSFGHSALWLAAVFLIVTTRTHMLPLLGLPLVLSLRMRSRLLSLASVFLILASGAWLAYAMNVTVDTRLVRTASTGDLLVLYLGHPIAFARIVVASLCDSGLSRFYADSFIGILGWLNAPLPGLAYAVLWAGLAVCAALSVSMVGWRNDWTLRLALAAMALAGVLLIFLAMLVTWTPHPATLIAGVQGRYFLAPMLPLAFALAGSVQNGASTRQRLHVGVLAGFALVSAVALTMAVFSRYH